MAVLIVSVVVALIVSAASSAFVGTLKPAGQMSFAPPLAQAAILKAPLSSTPLLAQSEIEVLLVINNVVPALVISEANVADLLAFVLSSCPSSLRPHWYKCP